MITIRVMCPPSPRVAGRGLPSTSVTLFEHHVSRSACTRLLASGGPLRHTLGPRFRLAPVSIYAAYGSNMHPEQMLLRCPHSPMSGTGWLRGWRLTFSGEDLGWEGAL